MENRQVVNEKCVQDQNKNYLSNESNSGVKLLFFGMKNSIHDLIVIWIN